MILKQQLKRFLKENSRGEKSFTLIELLIVIGILAILAVAVILVINPAEYLKQSRDSRRLSELQTINQAIGLYQADGGASFGQTNKVYISIPDSSATCANLGLPSLPSGWSYACANSTNYRKVDSNGWVPVPFTSISWGSNLSILPIDPINTTSTGNYYTYVVGGSWELNAIFESQRYRLSGEKDKVSKILVWLVIGSLMKEAEQLPTIRVVMGIMGVGMALAPIIQPEKWVKVVALMGPMIT